MMEDLLKLEKASTLVLSPPNKVSPSQRSEAEAIFLQLKRLQRPYSFCQLLLDSQSSDYVKFQAVSTMKEALSREWPVLSIEEKATLKQHTLEYLMTKHSSLPKYVREHLMVLLVLIIKRGVIDNGGQQMLNMFIDQMSHLLMEPSQIELGCSVLNTLLTEFSNASGSSAIGMPLEFHLRAKKVLEQNGGLLKILNVSIQILQHYTNEQKLSNTQLVSLLISLSLQILSWDFRSSYLYHLSSLTSSSGIPFRPSQDFSTILLNPSFLLLYTTIFSKVLSSPDLTVQVGQCLSQLATLSGPVFSCEQEKISYVINYVRGLLASVNESADVITVTVVNQISQCCRHLVTTLPRDCFLSLGEGLLNSFVQLIIHFVQFVCERTANPQQVPEDDLPMCEESLCLLLEVMVRLLEGPNDAMHKFLLPSATELFMVYLRSKLSQPLGTKKCETYKELNVDFEEDDLSVYEDELSYTGSIARAILPNSLPQLLTALQHSISECSSILQSFAKDQSTIPDSIDYVECLYENIHWLLMVATYTIADIVSGEVSIIPVELMDHSKSLDAASLSVPFQDLVLCDVNEGAAFLSTIDPVVVLLVYICRWCVVEKRAVENGLKDFISPQTSETAVWSLTSVLSPYLMMDEKCYDELSMSFVDVFGADSTSAKWILSFVMDKILFNLSVWYSEERLIASTLKMLSRLASNNRPRSLYLISTDQLWCLMRAFANGHQPFNILVPNVQKEVVAGLLACASGAQKNQYLNELLTPLSTRFNSLVLLEGFSSCCKDDSIRIPLISILEALSAIALATQTSMVDDIFSFLLPILQTCIQLFYMFTGYHDVTISILRIFLNVTEIFTIFLDDDDSKKLYEVCLLLITAYSKHHSGKYLKGVLADEDECDDLIMFIQILSYLTTKDYLDFGNGPTDGSLYVRPIEVVMKGLSIVLPIITEELLKYPELCKHFYELLHYVCEIFPEGIAMLDADCFHQVSKLIDLGYTQYGPEVCKLCVEDIESIASCTECVQLPIIVNLFQHFLKCMFEHIISVDFDTNMLNIYSGAIFQLICSLKDHQDKLLDALLSACITDTDQAHLQSTIQQLVSTIPLDGTRANKDKFRKNLKDFLPTLRGYLCVK